MPKEIEEACDSYADCYKQALTTLENAIPKKQRLEEFEIMKGRLADKLYKKLLAMEKDNQHQQSSTSSKVVLNPNLNLTIMTQTANNPPELIVGLKNGLFQIRIDWDENKGFHVNVATDTNKYSFGIKSAYGAETSFDTYRVLLNQLQAAKSSPTEVVSYFRKCSNKDTIMTTSC